MTTATTSIEAKATTTATNRVRAFVAALTARDVAGARSWIAHRTAFVGADICDPTRLDAWVWFRAGVLRTDAEALRHADFLLREADSLSDRLPSLAKIHRDRAILILVGRGFAA